MADDPPPLQRGDAAADAEREAPRYGWFAGVLEGRVGDPAALKKAAAEIAGLGVVGSDLEIEGGRFSLLFDDAPVPGARLSIEAQSALVEGLGGVVRAAAPGSTESTLRCALVYPTTVIETLFTAGQGGVEPVSRRRELDARDRALAPEDGSRPSASGDGLSQLGRKRGFLLLALVLLAGGLLAWNRGYFGLVRDTFFAPEASVLGVGTGPFAGALELTVEQRFGRYVCVVRRGPDYPGDSQAVDALLEAAQTPEDRAAAMAVAAGGEIGVALLDAEGKRLEVAAAGLAPLLTDEDASVEVELRARLRGQRVELSVDPRDDAGRTREDRSD